MEQWSFAVGRRVMGGKSARLVADRDVRDVETNRDGHVSSERMRRHDIGDAVAAMWFVDQLAGGVMRSGPLDPGLSYIANLLRRHVSHRRDDALAWRQTCAARLVPAVDHLLARASSLGDGCRELEEQIGDAITDMLRSSDRTRQLVALLSLLHRELDALRDVELDIVLREACDDIGGSG
jgi:hypothetical protein